MKNRLLFIAFAALLVLGGLAAVHTLGHHHTSKAAAHHNHQAEQHADHHHDATVQSAALDDHHDAAEHLIHHELPGCYVSDGCQPDTDLADHAHAGTLPVDQDWNLPVDVHGLKHFTLTAYQRTVGKHDAWHPMAVSAEEFYKISAKHGPDPHEEGRYFATMPVHYPGEAVEYYFEVRQGGKLMETTEIYQAVPKADSHHFPPPPSALPFPPPHRHLPVTS